MAQRSIGCRCCYLIRKTVKWWKKVFFQLVAVSETNSYLFYKETLNQKGQKSLSHSQYRIELCKDMARMMPTQPLSPRQRNACIGETDVLRLTARHFCTSLPMTTNKHGKSHIARRKCFVCASINKRKDCSYECAACRKPMCVEPCFIIYHTHADYKRERARINDP